MTSPTLGTLQLAALLAVARHAPPRTISSQTSWPAQEHCWWARLRTATPPDSVAAPYKRAFTTLGLVNAGWSRLAGTAWAEAGPTTL